MLSAVPYVRLLWKWAFPSFLSWHTLFTSQCSFFGNRSMCGLFSPVEIDHSSVLDHSCYLKHHLLQPVNKRQIQWIRNTRPEDHKNAVSWNYFLGSFHWESLAVPTKNWVHMCWAPKEHQEKAITAPRSVSMKVKDKETETLHKNVEWYAIAHGCFYTKLSWLCKNFSLSNSCVHDILQRTSSLSHFFFF